jgi:hypothetical protein
MADPSTGGGGTAPNPSSNTQGMGTGGTMLAFAGSITSAIGAFYAADIAKIEAESRASALEYQQAIAEINAEVAEMNAQQALLAGDKQIGAVTMKYGQIKGAARASMAARGVVLGEGSAQEVVATTDLMKEIDVLTINANAVREAEAARMQKVSLQNDALMAGASAGIERTMAGGITPFADAFTTFISGSTQVASSWYSNKSKSDSGSGTLPSVSSTTTK